MENHRNRSLGAPKSRKTEARGTPWRQQNAKLKKNGVVLNSAAPFLSILVKNESQDGGQNPLKINKKSMLKLMYFSNGFLKHFGMDFGAKMGEKSMRKRCQKHLGIRLEVELAKT